MAKALQKELQCKMQGVGLVTRMAKTLSACGKSGERARVSTRRRAGGTALSKRCPSHMTILELERSAATTRPSRVLVDTHTHMPARLASHVGYIPRNLWRCQGCVCPGAQLELRVEGPAPAVSGLEDPSKMWPRITRGRRARALASKRHLPRAWLVSPCLQLALSIVSLSTSRPPRASLLPPPCLYGSA